MPADDDRAARYVEIIRRIEQRKQQQNRAPIHSLLAAVLDALNAAGLLSAIKRRPPADMSAYGPKTFSGSLSSVTVGDSSIRDQWVGSVMWHKPKGYTYYQTLGLLGIWAIGNGSLARIVIGEKRLTFSAPVFNPESYYHHIKQKFDIFYNGDARPSLDNNEGMLLYDAVYDESQRLETRAILEALLRAWVIAYKPDLGQEKE